MRSAKVNTLRLTFLALLLGVVLVLSSYLPVSAAYLSQRTVTVATSQINALTSHDFTFTMPTVSPLASIMFEYCTNSPLVAVPCAAPGGLDVSTATIATQAGETGFSVHPSSTFNALILTRSAANTVVGPDHYVFNNITNPATPSITIYVRITTYPTTDATGVFTDQGSVAFSTAGGLGVGGFVPPYLTFCAAVTVAPDCSIIDGQLIGFGEFSRSATSDTTSQFAAATNDATGYNVYISGQTMTAGNLTIPALATGDISKVGVSQFGINLKANTVPSLGVDATGLGTGVPATGYDTSNIFRLVNGEKIAGSPLPTEFNRYTVSYIVNISVDQKPGFYATTMTYIATVSF